MRSNPNPEPKKDLTVETRRRRGGSCVPLILRALIYAVAITALVIFAPGGDHVFIYQGF